MDHRYDFDSSPEDEVPKGPCLCCGKQGLAVCRRCRPHDLLDLNPLLCRLLRRLRELSYRVHLRTPQPWVTIYDGSDHANTLRQERFEFLLKIVLDRKWAQQLSETETQRRLNIVAGAKYPELGHYERGMLVLDVLEKLRVDAEAESARRERENADLMAELGKLDSNQPNA